uniref:Putative secreted protein n=1 Tax=Anopheles darlingi TaxID=43151 RepID=A0A2M4DMI2_ANODA
MMAPCGLMILVATYVLCQAPLLALMLRVSQQQLDQLERPEHGDRTRHQPDDGRFGIEIIPYRSRIDVPFVEEPITVELRFGVDRFDRWFNDDNIPMAAPLIRTLDTGGLDDVNRIVDGIVPTVHNVPVRMGQFLHQEATIPRVTVQLDVRDTLEQ